MPDRARRLMAWTWTRLLLVAAGALVFAAFATLIGIGALARFAGTIAWTAALAGAVFGLVVTRSDDEAKA